MGSYLRLSPAPIVNLCVIIEKNRKLGVVKKGLVCQRSRRKRAALPFWTLKALFCRIPIFCLGKLCYLLTTTTAISGTTGGYVGILKHFLKNISRLAVILLGSDGYMV